MASGDMVVFESIAQSNLPRREKNALLNWWEDSRSIVRRRSGRSSGAEGPMGMLIQLIEAFGTGAVLGALHAELKHGLDINGIPADAALALFASVGGTIYGSELSQNIADDATAIFAFRKTHTLLTAIKSRIAGEAGDPSYPHANPTVNDDTTAYSTSNVHGDPVVAAAAAL